MADGADVPLSPETGPGPPPEDAGLASSEGASRVPDTSGVDPPRLTSALERAERIVTSAGTILGTMHPALLEELRAVRKEQKEHAESLQGLLGLLIFLALASVVMLGWLIHRS